MLAHDSERCRQTQAAAQELGGEERIEYARLPFGIHAAPGIQQPEKRLCRERTKRAISCGCDAGPRTRLRDLGKQGPKTSP